MREILFRGKTLTDKWVEGAYYKQDEFYGEKEDAHIIITSKETLDNDFALESHIVIPETVGQYTGLKDKNGNKIFEGDILQGEQYPFNSDGEYNYFAEVCYWDNTPEFGLYVFKNPKATIRGIGEGNTCDMQDWESIDWEIIGNIHDNPELLKGGD